MEIKGNFKKYIFTGDNGYSVGLFKIKECSSDIYVNKVVTFTGYFGELNEIDTYIFKGEFVEHFKYGEQFKTDSYEIVLPEEKDHIVHFLSSELFKGIGEKKAIKIVDTLGSNCLNDILKDPSILKKVKSLSDKQITTIYESLLNYNSSYNEIMELVKIGFSMKDALKIENMYHNNIEEVLKNPYQITLDIKEITFSHIEKIRQKLDIELNDINRVSIGIIYVINNLSFRSGNTYFSYDEIVYYSMKVLNVLLDDINKGISNLISMGKLLIDDDRYYLTETYEKEKYISLRIKYLLRNTFNYKLDKFLLEDENLYDIVFNEEQRTAIKGAINNSISIISGGPGTGKTTIIKEVVSVYQKHNKLSNDRLKQEVVLLAPTGRASKRISMQTQFPASTIHRFLKWNKEDNSFQLNEYNKSNCKFVIVDEVSMLDNDLFYNLLLGLKEECKILLIGDFNQLPSVGAGQVLKDLIESSVIPTTYLKTLYRQKENSNINLFAHNIINNNIDFSLFNENDDLTFVNCSSSEVKDVLKDYLMTYQDMSIYNFQVLAPIYKGVNGIDDLNNFIQNIVNGKKFNKSELSHNGYLYRSGDKIINLVNSVEDNIFNGDIGEIIKITKTSKDQIFADFDTNLVKLGKSSIDNIRLGYAISIHKAQGSEFDIVIIPVLNSYGIMLYKKLIYTGITRAKQKLILIGEKSALEKAILTDKDEMRKTSLKRFLS